LAAVGLALLAAPGSNAQAQVTKEADAHERYAAPDAGSYELPAIDHVGQHQLLGTSGKPEPLLMLKHGELAVISFVYLNCGEACPLATALLHLLDGELAKYPELSRKVELVTVSFDPARDTPAAMRELRERLAPQGRWRFLTGANQATLRPVLTDFGQDAVWARGEANATNSLRHVLKIFVVDANGDVRQIYSTGFLDMRLVLADLRTLLAAKS